MMRNRMRKERRGRRSEKSIKERTGKGKEEATGRA